jgi:hypothetical protein
MNVGRTRSTSSFAPSAGASLGRDTHSLPSALFAFVSGSLLRRVSRRLLIAAGFPSRPHVTDQVQVWLGFLIAIAPYHSHSWRWPLP